MDDNLLDVETAIAVSMTAPTHFGLLGLPEATPLAAVRKRYLLLARLLHPVSVLARKRAPLRLRAHFPSCAQRVSPPNCVVLPAQDKVNEGKDLNAHAEEAFKRVKDAYSAIREGAAGDER